jgi:beta-glucanase (GH16 family)
MTLMGGRVWRLGMVVLLVVAGGVGALTGGARAVTIDPTLPLPPLPVLVTPYASSGGLWIPTFVDEFDGTAVDPSKWSNGFGWGDTAGNFQAWCDPAANVVVHGALVQWVDQIPHGDKPYSGACLHTKNTFSQLYGYWEARIRVPYGRGLWSAFWGKPASEEWPPELDVEEIGGAAPGTVIMSAHWRDETGHRMTNQRYQGAGFSDDFHVFGAEWSPEGTIWYVDGVERARITDGAAEMAAKGPFYALLNMQVGLGGAIAADATTPFPAYQLVDYVRIWERPAGMVTP